MVIHTSCLALGNRTEAVVRWRDCDFYFFAAQHRKEAKSFSSGAYVYNPKIVISKASIILIVC